MPTDFWFRFSTYLSLVLACLCLGYAEWQFLPEVTVFTGLIVLLLVVSFLLDRRFELSLSTANALGLGIGVVAVVWMAWYLTNPPKDGLLAGIDWPTNMLPLIGPVLMALIPAKLFRPKHVGDWWAMHGVAVAGVALASSMSEDPGFIALLAAYAVCSVWALVLFFYRRSGGLVAPLPNRPVGPPAQLATPDPNARPPRWVFARTLVWATGAAAVALALFVSLPRSTGYAWVFSKKYYVTGESDEARLVMNKAGELADSDEVVFAVTATTARGDTKWDFDPDQHWRAREFGVYEFDSGKREWSWGQRMFELTYPFRPSGEKEVPPTDFGPDGYTVRFDMTAKAKSLVVASPVRWKPNRAPVRWGSGEVWMFRPNGTFWSVPRRSRAASDEGPVDYYVQTCGPGVAPDLSSPFELSTGLFARPSVAELRRYASEPYFQEFGRSLLDRLIAAGKLPPAARDEDGLILVPEEWHAEVARAFAAYLRDTDEFEYTTSLKPSDNKLDPLVDFLRNTRAGHCEWFAGSLAMVLRAVGIPAQLVTGFRGWDLEEDGAMVVRQRHAHAWVEALVSRPAPRGYEFRPETPPDQRDRVWYWLTLDPTPGSGTSAASDQDKNWFQQGASFLTDFLLRYDKEKQQQTIDQLKQIAATGWPVAVGATAVGLGGWFGWRWWRRRKASSPTFGGPDWYGRFQAILAARGFHRTAGQTPREFADATAAALVAAGHPAAELIAFVNSKLYRVRYAGTPLKPDELDQVTAALDQLERQLAGYHPARNGDA